MGRTIGILGAVVMLLATGGVRADSLGFAGSVTWFGQVPIMVAIDKGFFKEQGLDIEYQVILNSSDRLASVDAGSSAFSNLGRSSIIPAMARGDTNFFYIYNFDDFARHRGLLGAARRGFHQGPARQEGRGQHLG